MMMMMIDDDYYTHPRLQNACDPLYNGDRRRHSCGDRLHGGEGGGRGREVVA